ncbi:MAG: 6-phosphogluconolactonase [Chloroflexi bacterium]|nr:6-phosphogluconolactonase [Chloroflexota bacterium]
MPADPGEPEVIVAADPAGCAAVAAGLVASAIERAVAARGRADVATTGGSTPAGIYAELAAPPLRARLPWSRLHVWFGDDRYVPRGDPHSNVTLLDRSLVAGVAPDGPLPPGNVHPFPVEATITVGGSPAACARRYADEIRSVLTADPAGRPCFDAVIVGVGPDGHLLSIFPRSAVPAGCELATAVPAPTHVGPHLARVTLHPAVLDVTPALIAVIHGAAKAEIVARLLDGPRDPDALPAQRARRSGATWVIDAAAAAALGPRG